MFHRSTLSGCEMCIASSQFFATCFSKIVLFNCLLCTQLSVHKRLLIHKLTLKKPNPLRLKPVTFTGWENDDKSSKIATWNRTSPLVADNRFHRKPLKIPHNPTFFLVINIFKISWQQILSLLTWPNANDIFWIVFIQNICRNMRKN